MADVLVSVGGHAYRLACRDGEEPALRAAARLLDERAVRLASSLGALTESRLLLMAGLMVAGEHLDGAPTAVVPAPEDVQPDPRLEALAAQVEALALRLEALAGKG